MNTSERLSSVRTALESKGVRDVKFYFERGSLSTLAPSEVAAKVADFMECYVAGNGIVINSVGDAG